MKLTTIIKEGVKELIEKSKEPIKDKRSKKVFIRIAREDPTYFKKLGMEVLNEDNRLYDNSKFFKIGGIYNSFKEVWESRQDTKLPTYQEYWTPY